MNEFDYILVTGYGWSGSSAVVDILKEFKGCMEPDIEFRIIKDPYGIHDLYRNVVEKWDALNSDMAIKNFLWYMRHLNHKSKPWSMTAGLNYEIFFGNNFLNATDRFIKNLTDFDYKSTWWMFDFEATKAQLFARKLKKKIKRKLKIDLLNDIMFFSNPTEEEFCKYAQDYIDELFLPIIEKSNCKHIVLDQGVSIPNCLNEMKYLRKSKIIIVDRDPRDIYSDLKSSEALIGSDLGQTNDVEKYVKWHKAWRHNCYLLQNMNDVLFMQFEDLIFHYDESISKIADFLMMDKKMHTTPGKYFDPEVSRKNVGIWNSMLSEREIEQLQYYLGDSFVQ